MKKLVVLLALLVTAGMLWGQAAAAPAVTLNAVIGYIGAWDLSAGKEYSDQPRYEIKWTWTPDEFTKAYLEFEEGPMSPGFGTGFDVSGINATGGTSADWGWGDGVNTFGALPDKAWVVTDVGKAFKLPIGVTFKFGLEEWQGPDSLTVTVSDWEEYMAESPADFRTWGGQIEIMPAPMLTIRTIWAWNPDPREFIVSAYGTVTPIKYEFTYSTNSQDKFGDGWLEGGAQYVADVTKDINLGVLLAGEYDLQDIGTIGSPTWRLQAGAQVLYQKMASLGLAWRGQDQAETGGLQVQGWAKPMKDQPLELYVIAGLGLNDDLYAETFESLEASVKYTIGKTAYYLGYYFQPERGAAASSSIAKEWLDMDVAGANKAPYNDTGAIWVRMIMSL